MEILGLLLLLSGASLMLKGNITSGKEEPWVWQRKMNKPPF